MAAMSGPRPLRVRWSDLILTEAWLSLPSHVGLRLTVMTSQKGGLHDEILREVASVLSGDRSPLLHHFFPCPRSILQDPP